MHGAIFGVLLGQRRERFGGGLDLALEQRPQGGPEVVVLLLVAIGDLFAHHVEQRVDVHIRAIRKKLGEHRDLIETVRGIGYRFAELVG